MKMHSISHNKAERGMQVSNLSRYSQSWMCGPQHDVRMQQVPGYTGFISGVKSENQFSNGYAKTSAKSICGKINRDADFSPEKRYMTMN